ncbi:MAG: polyprenol monophosphomannose synthase [Deltaproteobacteria bacterium]|nr:polyprenol monophosphomannose synthase [Deltaproteobacteria bacterium]
MADSQHTQPDGTSRALICIPTYNEQDNVGPIVRAVREVVPEAHILVVDDNSPDGTGKLADELSAADPQVFVLHRPGKEGLGRAYLDAFRWGLARGYAKLLEFDADFSHNPKYLPTMLETLDRADVVVGSRWVPGGGTENWSASRKLISTCGSFYARTVLGMPVRDLTAGFVGWNRRVLEALDLERIESAGFAFQIEMKYRAFLRGFRIEELPIVFPDRQVGTSKMSRRILFEGLAKVWQLRFRVRRQELARKVD